MQRSRYIHILKSTLLTFSLFVTSFTGIQGASSGPSPLTITVLTDSPLSKSGGDDIANLKQLASGIGWEFSPNGKTNDNLRQLGIKWIRSINIDPLAGEFDESGTYTIAKNNTRLEEHLQTCRAIGANPHIIIAQGAPAPLYVDSKELQERLAIMGQSSAGHNFWNGDWKKLRSYWKAYFRYILVDSGFPNARFEVGNEPDIDGQFPRLVGTQGAMGSRALYEAYMDVYRNVSKAASEFEKENPETKVTLGGPALAWAFTFKFGELNWATEFLKDVSKEGLKLDFMGVHFYGNISSINGEYEANYPSFSEMLEKTQKARDKFLPGIPIFITEWGASYNTSNSEASMVNANNIGAAWSISFFDKLLESKVLEALYLVTTDMQGIDPSNGAQENIWGWPSLYVNPVQFGQPWPKAPAHIFRMIRDLAPQRVTVEGMDSKSGVNGIATVNNISGEVTFLIWNYKFQIPESNGKPVDLGNQIPINLKIGSRHATADKTITGKEQTNNDKLRIERWLVSEDTSNALAEFKSTGSITSKSDLQKVENVEVPASKPIYSFQLPNGGVTLIRFSNVVRH